MLASELVKQSVEVASFIFKDVLQCVAVPSARAIETAAEQGKG
jgi:hypothetical protein